jgi:hypothetical protein
MSFDRNSLIQNKLDLVVEDLSRNQGSLLDSVFPREQVSDSKYVLTVMPAKTALPGRTGKLADNAPARPERAALAKVAGEIDGRYEGSFSFSEAERRNLEGNNIQLERYAKYAQDICNYNIDADLHAILGSSTHFQSITREGAAWSAASGVKFVEDMMKAKAALGRRDDLIVIMGANVADVIRTNADVKARLSNYSAGFVANDELRNVVRMLGFQDLIIPHSIGDSANKGQAAVTLAYNFDSLVWIGRREAVYNVELGTMLGTFERDASTSTYLLKAERYINIQPTLESKLGGAFIASPLT